jgi:hypothetical protein
MLRVDFNFDFGERERMTERNEPMRAFGRHDAGKPGGTQDVALQGIALEHHVERFLAHDHSAFRDGDPFGGVCG